ncbi:hypothetical protein B0A48_10198 [Cryoendolithus antarcticus]|uniref:Uncharacterized protein n=1 Tax=Cryoendolithus antarcticus TaxID=1507870 RepID=A0A1V8SWT4_9PEZI|nr:hypothetical protein B0A48_10198 [Cryoendolithus antarcticus]
MNIYLDWTVTVLWWICYPVAVIVYYLAITLSALASFLWRPLAFLLQPVVYLGRAIVAVLTIPIHLLVKLEPLYNYLGIAALIGIIGGLGLAYVYKTTHRLLRLDDRDARKPHRDAKQHRQIKARQKAAFDQPIMSPSYLSPSDSIHSRASKGRSRNLLSTAIMEEVDSDY